MPEHLSQVSDPQPGPERGSPLHGYRGDRSGANPPFLPSGLTVAVSREAGSRGTSIAKRAGEKLGWEVYTQEMLEYIAQDGTVRDELVANLSPAALHWLEEQMEALPANGPCGGDPLVGDMTRVVLALA